MAKELYIREMRAGRIRKAVRYARTLPKDSTAARLAKHATTVKAQQYINIKNATERLELLLYANFDSKTACFCTFTFAADHLPANRKHTKIIFSDYLKKMRQDRKQNGRALRYIYTIEGEALSVHPEARPAEGQQWEVVPWRDKRRWENLDTTAAQDASESVIRLHVHCFMLLEKSDYETVRALWPYGHVYINQMKVNDRDTFPRLARYVTKERRRDALPNGDRCYVPSLNLEQPVIEGHWCSESETIEPPQGAELIHSGREDTFYTTFQYWTYRLPRPQLPPKHYKSKGSLRARSSRLTRK